MKINAEQQVADYLDKLIRFFEANKGKKPPKIGLAPEAYQHFLKYQRKQLEKFRYTALEKNINDYHGVEIYEVNYGNNKRKI